MIIPAPKADCPSILIQVECPDGQRINARAVGGVSAVDVMIPEGVCEKSLKIVGQFLDNAARPMGDMFVIQEPAPVKPKAEPKQKVKPEPKPEPKPEQPKGFVVARGTGELRPLPPADPAKVETLPLKE